MKQILFKVMGGAVFCLSLVFSSCGNLDNPLEEIGKNSTAVALSGALDEGAEVSFKFTTFIEGKKESFSIDFTKKSGNVFELSDWNLPDDFFDFDEELTSDEIKTELSSMFNLEYDKAKNQLKVSFVYPENLMETRNGLGEEAGEGDDVAIPLLTVVFEISNNKFTQYVYPFEGFVIWDGVSVNGEDKSSLLSSDYSKVADFYLADAHGDARAFSRTRVPNVEYLNSFRVYYKDKETWADVDKRYKEQGGYPLLIAYSEMDDQTKLEVSSSFYGDYDKENFAYILVGDEPVPFIYFDDELSDNSELVYVKPNEKLGYKADGETPNPKGYIFADSYLD